MQRRELLALGLAVLGLVSIGYAADKQDPTGTWKWTVSIGGQDRETTLKLKLEGDKLSGTITGRDNTELKIEEATFKDDEVAFQVTREFNGNKFVLKYKGKVNGDNIKGTTEFPNRDGGTTTREWEPKRQK